MLKRRPRLITRALLVAVLASVCIRQGSAQEDARRFDVAFVGISGASPTPGVHVIRPDGSDLKLSVPVTAGPFGSFATGSWSPDGSGIVLMQAGAEDAEMLERYSLPFHAAAYLLSADGSGYRRLLDIPVQMSSIAWSPDSRQLLFVSAYEDPRAGESRIRANLASVAHAVYVMDRSSRTVVRLTPLGRDAMFPSWSPDGRRVVLTLFGEGSGLRRSDVHVVNPDGSGLQALTTTEDVLSATWAPQGDLIALCASDGIFLMRPDGSGLRRVAVGRANSTVWSPDGRALLIVAASVRLLDITTGVESTLGERWLDATFAPDGRGVFFRTFDQSGGRIYFADRLGQHRTQVAEGTSFAVSPVGPRGR